MSSNRFQFVDREHLAGNLDGIDFGYNLSCLVRSPEWLLLWSSGTPYTSGRQTQYGASELYLWDRHPRNSHRMSGYKRLGQGGGRLSLARVTAPGVIEPIVEAFGDDAKDAILEAVRKRKTLIVEGGGGVLCPRAKLYSAPEMQAWRDNPNKADR